MIRPFSDADRPGMIALYRAAWHAAYDTIDGADAIERLIACQLFGGNPAMFDLMPGDAALVAERDGAIIGGIRGHPRDGIVHLSGMYVVPELQRSGVGQALLADLLAKFPGAKAFQADVRPTSTSALQFYERHGFQRCGTGRADAGGGHWVDMIEMRRTLA